MDPTRPRLWWNSSSECASLIGDGHPFLLIVNSASQIVVSIQFIEEKKMVCKIGGYIRNDGSGLKLDCGESYSTAYIY